MDNNQLITLITTSIGNFGFPIVLTAYLLIRFEKKIESLNATIQELMKFMREELSSRK
ncbi:YvrJ family protein [Paenibacillus sp. GCM10012303]|jgi:hypothetical protein|uniref:YvrJ family protein n=1 Tax=Paenibacillus sp. GCM10012303 TaxID=3317340 RepID=UPI00361C49E7